MVLNDVFRIALCRLKRDIDVRILHIIYTRVEGFPERLCGVCWRRFPERGIAFRVAPN